jgi:preprotein translocase subunit SecF
MTATLTNPPEHLEGLPGTPGVDRRHRPSDFLHERTNFNFLQHGKGYIAMFLVVVLGGALALAVRGLNLGIDFEGGVSWQVDVAHGVHDSVGGVRSVVDKQHIGDYKATISTNPSNGKRTIRVQAKVVDDAPDKVRAAIARATGQKSADVSDTQLGTNETFTATKVAAPNKDAVLSAIAATKLVKDTPKVTINKNQVTVELNSIPSIRNNVADALAKYAGTTSDNVSISTVGPTWGSQVSHKAILALFVFFGVLALYLAIRFEVKMSIAAIVAVLHDIIFTVAVYALTQFTVSPATVTAFLTILGFSLYDTVVVFDKIRENQASLLTVGKSTYREMANRSLNQVLMRSLSTTFVALMPVISLLVVGSGFFGATALEDFALALLAGLFVGSYSSIFVATPLLVWMKEREPQYKALIERRDARDRADARAAAKPVAARAAAPAGVTGPARRKPVVTPAAAGTPVDEDVVDDEPGLTEAADVPTEWDTSGVPGPPAVGRTVRPGQTPRGRQQRGKKRK